MTEEKILVAMEEAKRFLQKAEILLKTKEDFEQKYKHINYSSFPKERGFVKRSSMDLSRALSELRKPD